MDDLSASRNTRETAPVAYPRHHITANPQNFRSKLFFRSLLSFASTSKAPKLEIYTGLGSSRDWIRIPDSFLDSFAHTPFAHLRTLIFNATSPTTLALLYDMLAFMPALRSLEVMAHITAEDEQSAPDIPEFQYPATRSGVLRLERLVYGTGLALRTLVARVISPSADTLSEIDLYWHNPPKCAPALPRLPNVRSVITAGLYPQGMHLIRQCTRLSRLRIMMVTREHLGDVMTALEECGGQLCDLTILPWRADLDVEDAERLVGAIRRLPSLRSISIISMGIEDPSQLRQICRERRICLR